MGQIFRKSLLDKLSSPEQLDKMIVITPPSFWIALSGAAIIVVSAVVWSVFGRLPVNVNTQGIYVNEEGTQSVYSETSGVVREILIADGSQVQKGDVIARLDTEEIDEKIEDYEERITAVENITMDSVNDIVNADSKNLVDVKNQMITVKQNLDQDQAMLEMRTKELVAKRADAAASEAEFLAAEAAYYKSLYVGNSMDEQMDFTEAQNAFTNASGYLESANNSLGQAQIAYVQAEAQYNTLYNEYKSFMEAYDENDVSTKEAYEKELAQQKIALDAAKSTRDEAQSNVDDYKKQKKNASLKYEDAKKAYMAKTGTVEQAQQKQTELGSEYNQAMNKYSTDQNAVATLEDSVDQLTVQVQVDQQNVENQIDVIYSQFHATKESILGQLRSECEDYRKKKDQAQIKATADGKVSNLSISEGSVIGQGTELAKIQLGEGNRKIVVCYVPVSSGKKVHEGMEVMVYPSTVNKQEYGHMEAEVIHVDSYITSTVDMQKRLGDDKLVESFLSNGPVVEVVCALRTSDDTASGYYWSSRKGADLQIEEGTMIEADVVLEKKAPITMLIPYIKEKLTVKAEE